MSIVLGNKVKDRVTGFTGIAVARYSYINGCDRICVQPATGKDGKLPDSVTFDEPDLEVIGKGLVKENKKDIGGPSRYEPQPKVSGLKK